MVRQTENQRPLMRRGLQQCEMLREWPEGPMDSMLDGCFLTSHGRGTEVLAGKQTESVLVVISGRLEVGGSNSSGERFMLSLLGPGEIVGLLSLCRGVEADFQYLVRESCVLVNIPTRLLRMVLDAYPVLWRDIALVALARQHGNLAFMQANALASIPQKLARVLVRAAKWSGQLGTKEVVLPLSQSDLAAMVSVSRQTVNKELRILIDRQLVSVKYGEITILDLNSLRRLADASATAYASTSR